MDTGTLLAVPVSGVMECIGLLLATHVLPSGMTNAGIAARPAQLFEALRLLHSLVPPTANGVTARLPRALSTRSGFRIAPVHSNGAAHACWRSQPDGYDMESMAMPFHMAFSAPRQGSGIHTRRKVVAKSVYRGIDWSGCA
jgi:hypothetical protein